jgi:hypothetical protein
MVTKEQAREIARQECHRRGWAWSEPVYIRWGLLCYTVWGGGRKGGNLVMKIRKSTGEVINAAMSPL